MGLEDETRRRWRVRRRWRLAVTKLSLALPNFLAERRMRAVHLARASSASSIQQWIGGAFASSDQREPSVADAVFSLNPRTKRFGGLKSSILRSVSAHLGDNGNLLKVPVMEVKSHGRRSLKRYVKSTMSFNKGKVPTTTSAPQSPTENAPQTPKEKAPGRTRKEAKVVMSVDSTDMIGHMEMRTSAMGNLSEWDSNDGPGASNSAPAAIPYHMQGNAALNTQAAFAKRSRLFGSPAILAETERLWMLCLAYQEAIYNGVDVEAQGRGSKKGGGGKKGAKKGGKNGGAKKKEAGIPDRVESPNGPHPHAPIPEEGWTPKERLMYDHGVPLRERAVCDKAYRALSMAFQKVLVVPLMREEAEEQAVEDWECDSGGRDLMDWAQFSKGMFELADIWVDSIDEFEYALFLRALAGSIESLVPNHLGLRPWKDIKPMGDAFMKNLDGERDARELGKVLPDSPPPIAKSSATEGNIDVTPADPAGQVSKRSLSQSFRAAVQINRVVSPQPSKIPTGGWGSSTSIRGDAGAAFAGFTSANANRVGRGGAQGNSEQQQGGRVQYVRQMNAGKSRTKSPARGGASKETAGKGGAHKETKEKDKDKGRSGNRTPGTEVDDMSGSVVWADEDEGGRTSLPPGQVGGSTASRSSAHRSTYQTSKVDSVKSLSVLDMSVEDISIPVRHGAMSPTLQRRFDSAGRSPSQSPTRVRGPPVSGNVSTETYSMADEVPKEKYLFPPKKLSGKVPNNGGRVRSPSRSPSASPEHSYDPWHSERPWTSTSDGYRSDVQWDSPPQPRSTSRHTRSARVGPGSISMTDVLALENLRSSSPERSLPVDELPRVRTTRTIKKADLMVSGGSSVNVSARAHIDADFGAGMGMSVAGPQAKGAPKYDLGVPSAKGPGGRVRLPAAGSLLSPLMPQDSNLVRQGATCRSTQNVADSSPAQRAERAGHH